MVSVAKPWLICGFHGLTKVTMFFFFFVVKPWLIFIRDQSTVRAIGEQTALYAFELVSWYLMSYIYLFAQHQCISNKTISC